MKVEERYEDPQKMLDDILVAEEAGVSFKRDNRVERAMNLLVAVVGDGGQEWSIRISKVRSPGGGELLKHVRNLPDLEKA